jgi:hypothetical protein
VDRGHISDGLVCSDGLFLRIVVGWGFVVETVTELVLGLTDGPTLSPGRQFTAQTISAATPKPASLPRVHTDGRWARVGLPLPPASQCQHPAEAARTPHPTRVISSIASLPLTN